MCAGGLAVYHHLNAMRMRLPSTVVLRGLSDAGYFLNYGTEYPSQMAHLVNVQNSSSAFSPACLKDHADNKWECFFAEVAVNYLVAPVFALQSRFDAWQLAHISHISSSNQTALDDYGKALQVKMTPLLQPASDPSSDIKHGVWLSACLTHGNCTSTCPPLTTE